MCGRCVEAQLWRRQDSPGEPVTSFHLWIPTNETLVTRCASKAHSIHSAIPLAQERSYYSPDCSRTHHVAQASLKLSAILQPLPPECWYITHHSLLVTHTWETLSWEQVACNYLWILSHSIRAESRLIGPHHFPKAILQFRISPPRPRKNLSKQHRVNTKYFSLLLSHFPGSTGENLRTYVQHIWK